VSPIESGKFYKPIRGERGSSIMKIDVQVPNFTWNKGSECLRGQLREIARTADEVGLASLWVMDTVFFRSAVVL
jgi:hypothetical protein